MARAPQALVLNVKVGAFRATRCDCGLWAPPCTAGCFDRRCPFSSLSGESHLCKLPADLMIR